MVKSVENRLANHALEIQVNNKFQVQKNKLPHKNQTFFKFKSLTLDISRNYIDKNILSDLMILSKKLNIKSSIREIFTNKYISTTELKKVSHVYSRNSSSQQKNMLKMIKLYNDLISGKKKTSENLAFKNVIHIGIGGSVIGPKVLSQSLKDYSTKKFKIHYISSADTRELDDALESCNINETLFIIASKSFKTKEVLLNLEYIKRKFSGKNIKKNLKTNFIAITSVKKSAIDIGFDKSMVFDFSEEIPGRFSLTSCISLSVLLDIGPTNYKKFIDGFKSMDKHFFRSKYDSNIPLIMALISIWNINFLNMNALSICPYSYRLRGLVEHFQQQEMESNGKSTDKDGNRISFLTSPIVFGQSGSECQHSFLQMIHQGTHSSCVDFIGVVDNKKSESSKFLLSNMISQADICFNGKKSKTSFKNINNGTPSNIIILDSITPESIGILMSLYEHKVFLEGVLWNINSFDQWGVEYGKNLAKKIQLSFTKKPKGKENIIINEIRKKLR